MSWCTGEPPRASGIKNVYVDGGRPPPTDYGGHMKRPSIIHLIAPVLTLPTLLASQAGVSRAPLSSPDSVKAVMIALAGTWQFALYSSDRTVPVASGQREMQLFGDSTKLAWTETLVGQAVGTTSSLGYLPQPNLDQSHVGGGFLGYNASTGDWYFLGAYTREPDPIVLIGRADSSGRGFLFRLLEATSRPGTFVSSELRLVDTGHLEWVASDGRWRAVFTRVGHS
jgi:hypothetical protein